MKSPQQKPSQLFDLSQLPILSNSNIGSPMAKGHFALSFQYKKPAIYDMILQSRFKIKKSNLTQHSDINKSPNNSIRISHTKTQSQKGLITNDLCAQATQMTSPKSNALIHLDKLNIFSITEKKSNQSSLLKKDDLTKRIQNQATGLTDRLIAYQKEEAVCKDKSYNRNLMIKNYLHSKQRVERVQTGTENNQQVTQALTNFFKRVSISRKKKRSSQQFSYGKTFHAFKDEEAKSAQVDSPRKSLIKVQQILPQPNALSKEEQQIEIDTKELMIQQQQFKMQNQFMKNKVYRMLVEEGKNKIQQHLKVDFKLMRQQLIKNLQFMKRLKLTPHTLMTQEVFSYKPFQKKGSHELMYACKANNFVKAQEILKVNRFLVYDFDYIQLTALHWVCKRGHYETAQILLATGADVDSQDLIGRTPLYFAIESNSVYVVQLLLENAASPWSTPSTNYNEICKNKPIFMKLLNKSRKLHILMRMTPPAIRDQIWQHNVKGKLTF